MGQPGHVLLGCVSYPPWCCWRASQMLEDNQVLVQGMMANRYMNTFRDQVLGWNKKLMAVADVVAILTEIQRTWAYLESLFVASEEVKKELPEATVRFARIDADVKSVLAEFKQVQNCVACCNKDGLLKFLEKQQTELEVGLRAWSICLQCQSMPMC